MDCLLFLLYKARSWQLLFSKCPKSGSVNDRKVFSKSKRLFLRPVLAQQIKLQCVTLLKSRLWRTGQTLQLLRGRFSQSFEESSDVECFEWSLFYA